MVTASDKAADDHFGYSVAISSDGTRVAIGACLANSAGVTNAGKAYIFA